MRVDAVAKGGWILAELDDETVIERFIRGERGAFEQVVAAHGQRIARLAHRLLGWPDDVEDVVQDVFLAAWQNRKKLRGKRGTRSLDAWLKVMTINHCHTHRRRRLTRWLRRKRFQADHRPAPAPPVDTQALAGEDTAAVRAAVRRLPPRDREVLVLHYLQQTPIAEVGDLLGLSRNAVEVRLHRARKRLRAQLNGFLKDD